ncbi:MAG: HAD hydrolase-like protein [Myxococcota bacterium]
MRSGPTLLLDLDGTLTDPHDGIVGSIRHALERLGATPPASTDLAHCIGPPLSESFAELLGEAPDSALVRSAIDLYRERFDASGWRENRVYPAIPAFLDAARAAGFACFVATSKPGVFAERIARHFDLARRLDGVHGSELDGRRGAKPELLAHVVAERALDPARTVMVGDRRHDVAGARANGLASVGVLWGYGSRRELLDAGADALCDEPAALLAAAESLLASSGA